jgi:hypothetical protein
MVFKFHLLFYEIVFNIRFILRHPDTAAAYNNLGCCLERLGATGKAMQLMRKAHKVSDTAFLLKPFLSPSAAWIVSVFYFAFFNYYVPGDYGVLGESSILSLSYT